MVKCDCCKKEMLKTNSCSLKFRCIKINGKIFIRNTSEYDFNERCHDCNIINKIGNIHHFGCDVERCPKCKRQLISCDCKKQEIGINEYWYKLE
jgi:hypothetical protein